MSLLTRLRRTFRRRIWVGNTGYDSSRVLNVLVGNLEGMAFRCALDPAWTMLFVSAGCEDLTGYGPEALLGNRQVSYESMTHPQDQQRVREVIAASVGSKQRYQVEYRIRCRNGTEKWVLERGQTVVDESGRQVVEGFVEDVTERILGQIRLAEAELRYRSIFEHSDVGMFQTTGDGRYLAANQALADLYGYPSPEALLAELADIARHLYVDDKRRVEFQRRILESGRVRDFESEVLRADGSRIWISENAHGVHDTQGNLQYYEGTVVDVTERHRYEQQLEFQASHDPLTGLPNRNLLQDRLQQAIHLAARVDGKVGVAFVDLDNFKIINDSLGHATGDQLLVGVAGRLLTCLRDSDTVARYGGDEFVLILVGQSGLEDVARVLERIQAAVAEPIYVGEHVLHVGASIGVSVYPDDGAGLQTLLSHADAAMYHAKAAGKGRFQFYTKAFNRAVNERFALESALRGALPGGEMRLHYQPRVNATGQAYGCEALLRWTHSQLGPIGPDRFIGLAEETGIISKITEFVLDTACRDAMQWGDGSTAPAVAVNVSSSLFADGRLPGLVGRALARWGLPACRLEVEVTESVLAGNVDHAARQLRELRALGVRIALDDFGTGYSSLSYLRKFPFDVLKVDRSFVLECDQTDDARALVRAIISMGHSLGLAVVAEGIERSSQLSELAALGCEEFQGYLFAVPMPASDVATWFRRNLSPRQSDGARAMGNLPSQAAPRASVGHVGGAVGLDDRQQLTEDLGRAGNQVATRQVS